MNRKFTILLTILVLLVLAFLVFRRPLRKWYRIWAREISTGMFQDPEGLGVDRLGNVYVADEDRKRFLMLDPTGKPRVIFDTIPGYEVAGRPAPFTTGDSFVVVGPGHIIAIAQFNLVEFKVHPDEPEGRQVELVRIFGGHKGTAQGDFGDPEGVSRDTGNGDVYVTDEDNRRIQVFDRTGKWLRDWPVVDDPESICLYEDRVYVSFSKNGWVGCFHKDGKLRFRFGEPGSGPGQFKVPDYVAVSPKGRLYVTDQGNHRVQVFDLAGKYQSAIGGYGRQPGRLRDPEDLAFDPDGNLVVNDSGNHRVQVFSPAGRSLRIIE